jgi:hypothetical protein
VFAEGGTKLILWVEEEVDADAIVDEGPCLVVLAGSDPDQLNVEGTKFGLAVTQLREELEAGKSTVITQDLGQHRTATQFDERPWIAVGCFEDDVIKSHGVETHW